MGPSGCRCPVGVNTCVVGSLFGPCAVSGHAELAWLLLPTASPVENLVFREISMKSMKFISVEGIRLAAVEPSIFSFCLVKDGQVLYQLSVSFSRAQCGLGGLSGAAGESEGDPDSISWLSTTEVIPKSGEVVV